MTIADMLQQAVRSGALDSTARAFGIDQRQLQAILDTVLPALTQRMEANTLSRGGVADLLAEAGRPEHRALLDDPSLAAAPWAASAGVGALDTVFGDKAKSRALAARAAANSGVSQDLIQKLLPILASLVMGAIAKGSQGGLGDIMKRLPDLGGLGGQGSQPGGGQRGRTAQAPTPRTTQVPVERGPLGGPATGGPMAGGPVADAPYGQGSPLPLPGEAPRGGGYGFPGMDGPGRDGPLSGPGSTSGPGPYGDLPDIIRRGGQQVDGGPLSGMVRNILGSLLGFQSKGVMGWIIRFLVVRYGWGILKSILGGVLKR